MLTQLAQLKLKMTNRKLPNWIESFLTFTEETEPPVNFRRWVAISVIAGCLERKCYLSWEGRLFPNMYVVLVSPAGRARKGTAMGYGRVFLEEMGVHLSPETTTREALIRVLNESLTLNQNETTNTFHRSMTIYADELAVFLNQQGDTRMIRDLTDWFDCRSTWRYMTKDKAKSDEMANVFVNMCGGTTPETMASIMPREVIAGGLSSRIIFVYEKDKGKIIPIPARMPIQDELEPLMIGDLHRIKAMKGEFKTTEQFLELVDKWTYEHENNPPFQGTLLASYAERRRVHAIKLAMICCAARTDSMVIDAQDLNLSIQVLKITEVNMLLAFAGVGQSDLTQIMPRVITELAKAKRMPYSKLLEMFHHDADDDTMQKILRTLRSMKKITLDGKPGDMVINYTMEKEDE